MFCYKLVLYYVTTQIAMAQLTMPQCDCVQKADSQSCMQYDSRFQASSLEEAMYSFPDLSIGEQHSPTPLQEDMACTTEACKDCQQDIRKRLKQLGLLPKAINDALRAQGNSTCTKYRFSRDDDGLYNHGRKRMEIPKESSSGEESSRDHHRQMKRRQRRQAANDTIIGTRFVLSCSTKGITSDSTGLVSLCSSCWIWRKLPSNYSPQYVNELICDESDNSCLSGYASCSVGTRAIEVVRNDSGVLTSVAMTAGSYCECRVQANSVLQSFVRGESASAASNVLETVSLAPQ